MPGTEVVEISNAAYGIQQNNQTLTRMASSTTGKETANQLKAIQEKEKQLLLDNQNKKLQYEAKIKMEETRKKIEKDKIKRSTLNYYA